MSNITFQNILKVDIISMIAESKAIEDIDHKGLKGSIREYGIGRLISKYLPLEWEIGYGEIQDSIGNSSSEIDLLIYNLNILPPALFGELLGVYPVESCQYVFEIKTTSNATEIKTTIEKFEKLKSLKLLNKFKPNRVYFAFSSDLNRGLNELQRYKKYDPNFYTDPAINILCVIGQGYWFYKQDTVKDRLIGGWLYFPGNVNYNEVTCLIGGIINTLNGNTKPHFGNYILPKEKTILADYKEI